jgi:hypothetical protein
MFQVASPSDSRTWPGSLQTLHWRAGLAGHVQCREHACDSHLLQNLGEQACDVIANSHNKSAQHEKYYNTKPHFSHKHQSTKTNMTKVNPPPQSCSPAPQKLNL